MEILIGVAVSVIAAVILAVGGWFFRDRLGWLPSKEKRDLRERLARVEGQLELLTGGALAPALGTQAIDTKALAEQATENTERLLAEAIELQRAHKEREAIDRLLTAYNLAMPPEAKAELHLLAGNGFLRLADLGEAEGHYRQALAAAEEGGEKQGRVAAFGNLGLVYADRGDLDRAEEHHKKSLSLHEEIGDKLGQANQLGNLGNVYTKRGALNKAEEHHKMALALDEEIGDKLGQAQDLGNLGLVYRRRGDLDRAEEHHRKSLSLHEEIGDKQGQANQLGNLGNVYAKRGDLDRAEEHHRRALVIEEEIGDKLGQANSLGNLGLVVAQRGDNGKARDLLQQATALYEASGAGGEGPEIVRKSLQRLEAQSTDD